MAFGESWVIGIMLRFAGGQAMRGFQSLGSAAGAAEGQITKAQKALAKFDATTVAAGTRIAGAFALIGGAMTIFGVQQAAKFQLAMVSVYAATGANLRQQKQLADLAMHMSGQTAQSSVTMAQEMSVLATAGINDPGRLSKAFPLIAKAADVMYLSPKHMDPVDATMRMAQLSHLFGHYSGPKFENMIDQIVRMMFTQPEGINSAITQGKYFIGIAQRYGVTQNEIFDLLGMMGQTGLLRSRGGTGVRAYMTYMMGAMSMTDHQSKLRREAMLGLKVWDSSGRNKFIDQKGNFHNTQFLQYLNKVGDAMAKVGQQGRFGTWLQNAFGTTGGTLLSVLTTDTAMTQMGYNRTARARIAPPGQAVEAMWGKYSDTVVFKFRYFLTNLQNVFQNIFMPLLPDISKLLNTLGGELGRFADWLNDNPDMAGMIGKLIIALTGLSVLRFALGGLAGLGALASLGKLGLTPLALSLRFLDNVLLAGIGRRLWDLGKAIGGLQVATTASGGVTTLAGAIRSLAGAVAAFMASPAGKLLSLGSVLLGTTSFVNRDSGFWDTLQSGYGQDYVKWAKSHGVNVNNYDPRGKFGGETWLQRYHPGGGFGPASAPTVHVEQHFHVKTVGTTEEQANKIVAMALKGIRSAIQSRGDTSWTNPQTAPVLGMEGAAITHGMG